MRCYMPRFLAFLMCIICLLAPAQARETYHELVVRLSGVGQQIELAEVEQQLFQLANQFRQSNGLPALARDQAVHAAALAHATDMLLHNYMGHNASTGQDFDGRMRALRDGALVLPSMGENAARLSHADAGPAQKLFHQWVNSPPHRHTLLSRDYLKLATGVVSQNGQIYADQIFIGPEVVTNMQRAAPEGAGTLY